LARWKTEPPIRCYDQNEGLTSTEADWVIELSTPFGGLGEESPDSLLASPTERGVPKVAAEPQGRGVQALPGDQDNYTLITYIEKTRLTGMVLAHKSLTDGRKYSTHFIFGIAQIGNDAEISNPQADLLKVQRLIFCHKKRIRSPERESRMT
jgi:hypothetical protein